MRDPWREPLTHRVRWYHDRMGEFARINIFIMGALGIVGSIVALCVGKNLVALMIITGALGLVLIHVVLGLIMGPDL